MNPQITTGIVASVQKNNLILSQMEKVLSKAKVPSKENKYGDETLYSQYKNFKLELRKVIKYA